MQNSFDPPDNAVAIRLREIVYNLINRRCYPSVEELNQIDSDSKIFPELARSTIRVLIDIIRDSY